MLRQPALDKMEKGKDDDLRAYLDFILKDESLAMLMKVFETLKNHSPDVHLDEVLSSLKL